MEDKLDTVLKNLSFDFIEPNEGVLKESIRLVHKKQQRARMLIISGLSLMTLVFLLTIYFIYHLTFEQDYLHILFITLVIASYSYVILSILYYFKVFDYLKSTFKISHHY